MRVYQNRYKGSILQENRFLTNLVRTRELLNRGSEINKWKHLVQFTIINKLKTYLLYKFIKRNTLKIEVLNKHVKFTLVLYLNGCEIA